jgi:hypothetical protein
VSALKEPFIPFVPNRPAATAGMPESSAQLKVLPQVEPKPAFKSIDPSPTAHRHGTEPRVTLQRDGDKVTGIRVECACGQVIELACSY